MVTNGGGSRHLRRLQRAIELTQPSDTRLVRRRAPVVATGAIIFVLSTFLDDEAPRMAALWRGSGHRVIAVDVLPEPRFAGATPAVRVAHRIVMMERRDRIASLVSQGVELLTWQDLSGGARRMAQLRALSRPAAHGRAR